MSERIDKPQTVEDALATRVEDRRGPGSPWAEALRELGAVDRAVYHAVAVTPTPHLDDAFRQLSKAANYSRLWLGMAAAIATLGGRRGRRVALEGVARDRSHVRHRQSGHQATCPSSASGSP